RAVRVPCACGCTTLCVQSSPGLDGGVGGGGGDREPPKVNHLSLAALAQKAPGLVLPHAHGSLRAGFMVHFIDAVAAITSCTPARQGALNIIYKSSKHMPHGERGGEKRGCSRKTFFFLSPNRAGTVTSRAHCINKEVRDLKAASLKIFAAALNRSRHRSSRWSSRVVVLPPSRALLSEMLVWRDWPELYRGLCGVAVLEWSAPGPPTSLPSPVRCDAFLTPARLWVLPALVRTTQRRSVVRLGCADALHSHLGPCCDANAGTRPRKGREREREREYTEADERKIQHCFCYTSTVLTSTLAFQKEQKLKFECQFKNGVGVSGEHVDLHALVLAAEMSRREQDQVGGRDTETLSRLRATEVESLLGGVKRGRISERKREREGKRERYSLHEGCEAVKLDVGRKEPAGMGRSPLSSSTLSKDARLFSRPCFSNGRRIHSGPCCQGYPSRNLCQEDRAVLKDHFFHPRMPKCQTPLALLQVAKNLFTHLDDVSVLLQEIIIEARNLSNAEICSVFLLDRLSHELVAKVFDGGVVNDDEPAIPTPHPPPKIISPPPPPPPPLVVVLRLTSTTQNQATFAQIIVIDSSAKEFRIPADQGIAGHVATTGKILNIKDAYSHPLFYRGVDDSTGFRTRNILCFPIKDENNALCTQPSIF
ncbi:hypothetical protein JZ751_017031, partial [Albula glossodonta]